VPAQTDRTDRQTPAQATVEARQSGALDLSSDLSRGDRKTDCRQIVAINQPAAPDDFPELPAFLRRVPVTQGRASALGPPGGSPDGADGRTQVIEEEASEWTERKAEVLAVLGNTVHESGPLPLVPRFDRKARVAEGEPGLEMPCAARRGRIQEVEGAFLHFCVECGAFGAFGYGVSLGAGRLGRWYCAEHRPPEHKR